MRRKNSFPSRSKSSEPENWSFGGFRTMNQEAALCSLEEQKKQFLSRIPANAPKLRTRYLENVVEEQIEAAQKHLQALYENWLADGAGFETALTEHASHPKYAFWLEGIRRHLQMCKAVLAEQPAGV